MKSILKKRFVVMLAVPFVLLVASAALAANGYTLAWWTVDGGGGQSSGGGYSLHGTIGQHDTGAMRGGGYSLNGGFWANGPDGGFEIYLPLVLNNS